MNMLDFEFVSTHRNRSLWTNPCLFEVPWSGNGQSTGLNAIDPISNQTPIVAWTGQNISTNATVISQTSDNVIVTVPTSTYSNIPNYYQGAELSKPPSYRINGSRYLSAFGGLDYVQLNVVDSNVQSGDVVTIQTTTIPNTLFVPTGSDLPNAYNGKYLYNETFGQGVVITGYDSVFHKLEALLPGSWSATDQYSIRDVPPTKGNFPLGGGNTTTTVNLTGINVQVNPGDFLRLVSTQEVSKIVKYDVTTNIATISPPLVVAPSSGMIVELLTQTSDNYRTLSYAGTSVGQHEQTSYYVSLVSGTIPNIPIRNGVGGYPVDYPFLYVEFYDTNYPTQNNLFSNNHSNKSYFKVTTPTGQLMNRTEKFTKVTGDLNHKTIRFRPTSNFRVVWRLPSGEDIQFEEYDSQSPYKPKEHLQTSALFSLTRAT